MSKVGPTLESKTSDSLIKLMSLLAFTFAREKLHQAYLCRIGERCVQLFQRLFQDDLSQGTKRAAYILLR